MKKILTLTLLALVMMFVLTSCDVSSILGAVNSNSNSNVDVTVNEDGYVVVNGIETKHKVHTKDEIGVDEDGYVVVNGNKTEHKVDGEDQITVEDGYVVVNGTKTDYQVYVSPIISVIDGYVAVNGEKTNYKVDTPDVIEVDANGYLVVNGAKTDHQIYVAPVISVIDGYVAVNGEKTNYKVDTPDVIEVDANGYLVVNGVKTDYMVSKECVHVWDTVTVPATCQSVGYDVMTCKLCGKSVQTNETAKLNHTYSTSYSFNDTYHWFKCTGCDSAYQKEQHTPDANDCCSVCQLPLDYTVGIIYGISADGTYAEVIGYTGTSTKVRIAEEYNGLPVKVIYEKAFYRNSIIESVIIPDSVTTIGDYAFYGSDGMGYPASVLKTVVIGNGVTSIGKYAFSHCIALQSLTLGNSLVTIGEYAFEYCSGLKNVTIPGSVEFVGYRAFSSCWNITNLVISNGVKKIGDYAFAYCSSLTSLIIPDSVTDIGARAFIECRALSNVTVGQNLVNVGNLAFDGCNSALYIEHEFGKYVGDAQNPYAVLVAITNKNMITYEIHPDTELIGAYVFEDCSRLTSITIPNSVIGIGEYAFSQCNALENVTLGNSVKHISENAFYGCPALKSIVIPESVTYIGRCAFSFWDLTSITFRNPNGWSYFSEWDMVSGTPIDAAGLSNPYTAKETINSAYHGYTGGVALIRT